MAIHYHGLPIWPATAAAQVLSGRHAFVSFARPEQEDIALEVCQSFALDNGAFSVWKRGEASDWAGYAKWVGKLARHPAYDFCVLPDSIEGGENENDALLDTWGTLPGGAPVWHLHESLDRLGRLVAEWPRVCLGSSGAYSSPGTTSWWNRMAEALDVACDEDGVPLTKLHGLRMLNPDLRSIPFSSMDSTTVGQNVGLDQKWAGPCEPPTKAWRAVVLAERLESVYCASRWVRPTQRTFALGMP